MSGELRVCLTGNKKGNTFNKTDFAVSMVFKAGSQTQTVKFCLTHTPQQRSWLSLSSWLTLKPPWMAQSFEPDPAQDFSLFKGSFSSSLLKTVSRLWLARYAALLNWKEWTACVESVLGVFRSYCTELQENMAARPPFSHMFSLCGVDTFAWMKHKNLLVFFFPHLRFWWPHDKEMLIMMTAAPRNPSWWIIHKLEQCVRVCWVMSRLVLALKMTLCKRLGWKNWVKICFLFFVYNEINNKVEAVKVLLLNAALLKNVINHTRLQWRPLQHQRLLSTFTTFLSTLGASQPLYKC